MASAVRLPAPTPNAGMSTVDAGIFGVLSMLVAVFSAIKVFNWVWTLKHGAILVTTRDGGRVPLSQLSAIQVVNGASIIARRENRRQISVRTNIRGRDQGGFVVDAQRRLAAAVKLPDGYRVEWGGQFENLEIGRALCRERVSDTV